MQEQAKKRLDAAREEAKRIYEEAMARKNETEMASLSKARKKREMSDEKLQAFREKRQKTAAKKREKLERYDSVVHENTILKAKLVKMMDLAVDWVVDRQNGDKVMFEAEMQTLMDEVEDQYEEEEEEEEGEEVQNVQDI